MVFRGRSLAHLRARRSASRLDRPLLSLFALAACVAIVAPVAKAIYLSMREQTGILTSRYSWVNYQDLFTSRVMEAALNSLITAVGAMLLSTIVGGLMAWIVVRTDTPLRRTIEVLSFVPFFLSPLIGAIAWDYLASPKIGMFNRFAQSAHLGSGPLINLYSLGGIIFVVGLYLVPFAMMFVGVSLRQMDPNLEQAARACGAGRMRIIVKITMPLAAPALISSAILTFVLSVENLAVPLILGTPVGIQTLATNIYSAFQTTPPNYGFGAAVGCLMMVVTTIFVSIQRKALGSRSFETLSGRTAGAQVVKLGRGRWITFVFGVLYVLTSVVLPLGLILIVALSRTWNGTINFGVLTLRNFTHLFSLEPQVPRSLVNSITTSVIAATVVIVLATILVFAIERVKIRGRSIVDVLLTFPIAVPSLVLAAGLIYLLLRTPLYGTITIIAVAYVIRFIPYGQRAVAAALAAVHPELDEAARTSGAGWFRRMLTVLLPLLRPGLISGWLLVFVTCMREIPMSLLLQHNGTETLSVGLYYSFLYDSQGTAAAFTFLQIAVLLICALLFWRFSRVREVKSPIADGTAIGRAQSEQEGQEGATSDRQRSASLPGL